MEEHTLLLPQDREKYLSERRNSGRIKEESKMFVPLGEPDPDHYHEVGLSG